MTRVLACLVVAGCRLHFDEQPLTSDASVDARADAPPGSATLTFGERPTSLRQGVTADAYVNEMEPSINYGGNDSHSISGSPGFQSHALLRFDLSSVPPGSPLLEARLAIVIVRFGDEVMGPISGFEISESWTEGTLQGSPGPGVTWTSRDTGLAWSTAGGTRGSQLLAPVTPTAAMGLELAVTIDTAIVQRWIDTPTSNFGLLLAPSDGTAQTHYHFEARESLMPSSRPELTLVLAQ